MSLVKLPIWVLLTLWGVSSQYSHAEVRPLRLASAEDVEPYVYHQESGQVAGIDYEIVREVLGRASISFDLKSFPRPRISLMLQQGFLDGLLTTTAYNDQDMLETLWLSVPLYVSTVSTISRKDAPKSGSPPEMIPCVKAGILRGFSYRFPNLDISRFKNPVEVDSAEQLVKLTMYGRVDCAISEDITFMYQARKLHYFDDLQVVEEISTRPVVIALSRRIIEQNDGLGERINRLINEVREEDIIDNIIIKYLTLGNS
ncbi:amino acid ABC transporter substrate-binding protein [Hahella sp. CCB-MM4]|uniref:substrate-binding periplasmic protein n=1 Tax=Hahella sp. (strain CCB-MM4) TaxID=1926491 RepID=UPI000B9A696F|nr:transporter substrate-binding domain-containing protein [Hahella sp. CCB-MM4]OZG71216.1 amino acid ABC transporter substrate-binding protein [Hahella sp. CCB-MM4]